MARQNIFTGTTSNDGTGDTLRVAAQKINENFVELYQFLGGDSDQLGSAITINSNSITLNNTLAYASETIDSDGPVGLSVPLTIFNSASPLTMTLADGSVTGEVKKFINNNTGAATVTPSNFAQGTSFTLSQNGSCETIWGGTNWHIFGGADSDDALTITS